MLSGKYRKIETGKGLKNWNKKRRSAKSAFHSYFNKAYFTLLESSLPALNFTTFFAAMLISLPV